MRKTGDTMEKREHHDTGKVELCFTGEEFRRMRRILAVLAAAFVVGMGAASWSVYSMASLRAENELYRNQLRMAEEKMDSLSQKIDNVERISGEVESMVNGRASGSSSAEKTSAAGGIGGGATVPDRAAVSSAPAVETPGDLLAELVRMHETADREMKKIISLRSDLMTRSHTARTIYQAFRAEAPSLWPVSGEISSGFGWRESPGGIGSSYHEGVDIATEYDMPVRVTADGVVTKTGWVDGYGYLVEVRHANGITTRYGHNSAIVVQEGQEVHQGDMVALAGSTGNSTGPHTHYEVRVNGTALDPMLFLK